MENLIDSFHIDIKLLIAQIVNFTIVLFVLYWFGLRKLGKKMEERTNKIEQGIKDAEGNKELLEKAESDYKKTIAQARTESQEILAMAKTDAETKRKELMSQAKTDVDTMIERGKQQLEQEKSKMMSDVQSELATLVTHATEKILTGTIDAKVDEKLVKKSLEEVK